MKKHDPLLLVAWIFACIAIFYVVSSRPSAPSAPTNPAPAPIPAPAEKIEILFFTMPGCVPCGKLKEAMNDPQVKQYLNEHFTLKMVDSSDPLAEQHSIKVVPTLIAIQSSGVTKRHVGSMTSHETLKWLKSIP